MANVKQERMRWQIVGPEYGVWWNVADGSLRVEIAGMEWESSMHVGQELRVLKGADIVEVSLADARRKEGAAFRTGYCEGVRVRYSHFKVGEDALDVEVSLSVAIEHVTGDLLIEVNPVRDPQGVLQECCWPPAFSLPKAGMANHTVLPSMQGCLIPSDWDVEWKGWYGEKSNTRALYMPWWGQVRGNAGCQVILETPWDAGVRVKHPAAGPTTVRPVWLSSFGSLRYARRARYVFSKRCTYVTMAKRYRRHAMEQGLFRSLAEKEAANPKVGQLRGTAVVHTSILYHIQPESPYFSRTDPKKNHDLTSFAARSDQLVALRRRIPDRRIYVHLDGWGFRGYDNLHPDVLPPCPEAGGWEGLRGLTETCTANGILFCLHDQYRDYYYDGATFDQAYAVKRRGGEVIASSEWYGGRQALLCASHAPGFIRRNYDQLAAQGIRPDGVYLDVFAIADLDECFDPDHPMTREDCARHRALGFRQIRSRGMVLSSEEPVDFAIPDLDLVHHAPYARVPDPGQGPALGIPVPLFSLVYHDAVVVPWTASPAGGWGIPSGDTGFLHAMLNAGVGYLPIEPGEEELRADGELAALHERVGWLEMTEHSFLDDGHRRQRTAFSNGTTVEVDFESGTHVVR